MNAAAYLDADASSLADREHTNRHTNTNGPALTDSALQELEYAADLFRRADSAVSAELVVLRGLNLEIDCAAIQRACSTLLVAAVAMHIHVMRERERRAA